MSSISLSPPTSPITREMIQLNEKDANNDTEDVVGDKAKDDAAEDEAEDASDMDDDEYTKQSSYQAQVKEDLNLLVSNFDSEQLERYNLYRETGLKGPQVKRVLAAIGMTNVPPTVLPLIGGVAKVFVGEIVEKAREVQAARKETGPLSPEHIREAYRLYTIESGRVGAALPARGRRLLTR